MRTETLPSLEPRPVTRGARWRHRVTRGDLAAQLVLLASTLAFFWPMIRPIGARWYMAEGDFSRQFYPFRWFEAHEWWHGRIPLWNPDLFAGHPFQADIQTAVFYPFALLSALVFGRHGFPFYGLEAEVIWHTFLAGVFTYWLARRLVGSRLAALIGALAFAFGGFITTYPAEQLPLLETAVWLPLIVLCLELSAVELGGVGGADDGSVAAAAAGARGPGGDETAPRAISRLAALVSDQRRVSPWLISAGLLLGIAVLAGHPQTVLYIGYSTEGYLLWRYWRARVGWQRTVGAAVLYPIVAACLSAVQLLPTLEFLGLSTRDRMSYAQAAWGYRPSALWEILVPLWHGEKALSIGVVGLTLALIGAWASRREPLAFWTLAGLLAIPLSLGGATPLFWVLYHAAPGWDLFRDQERAIYLFSFTASLLAARGAAALQRADNQPRLSYWWSAVVAVCALGFASLDILGPRLSASPALRANLGLNALVLALTALVFLVLARSTLSDPATTASARDQAAGVRTAAVAALAVLTLSELFALNVGNNLSPVFPVPVARLARTAAFIRTFPEPFRVRGISEAVFPSDYGAVLGLPTIGGDTPFQIRRMRDMLAADADWRVWQILNVKFFLSDGGPLAGLRLVFQDGGLKTYFMTDSLPRAWAVRAVEVARDPSQARQLILAPGYHPGNIVVLERKPSIGPFSPGPRPDVRITHLDPQRITIDADSGGNAMLVLAQQYYPDWQAYRDGKPVTTFRANYLAMAFELPPGKHHFEIVYRPWTFYAGALISLLTVVGALALVVRPRPGRGLSR